MKHNMLNKQFIWLFFTIIPLISVHAEVIMDGSLGQPININGPNYQIQPEYGKQAGTNLFHSFEQFNINHNESTNFIVSGDIENIISRITGGEPSHIDGLIRSTRQGTNITSNANLFLLNPFGIVFSENASLDIGGSFHASTADYLKLGNNDKFYSSPIESEVLSTSPPQAFGFMDDTIGDILFEGQGEIAVEEYRNSGLHVNNNQTISLIGGNINIFKGTFFYDVFNQGYINPGSLIAPAGNINLVAVASTGEVFLKNNELDTSAIHQLGRISIADFSLIDVSGELGGNVRIRAEQLDIHDSYIFADTGFNDGGVIDILANKLSMNNSEIGILTSTGGNAGDILINANDTITLNNSLIYHISENNGNCGNISINAKNLMLFESSISIASFGFGNCGNISIDAKNLFLNNGSQIFNRTWDSGNGGDITIQNCEILKLSGHDIDGQSSHIHSLSGDNAYNEGNGDAGNIIIKNTQKISIEDGCQIATVTYTSGHGGDISILNHDQIVLSGMDLEGFSSTILSDTRNTDIENAGDAGNLFIQTKALELQDGAKISSSSQGTGNAGNIRIEAKDTITLSGCERYDGQGSTISNDTRRKINAGQAGRIEIFTNTLSMTDGAQISSSSTGTGDSGTIIINASEQITLNGRDQFIDDNQQTTIFSITTDQENTPEQSGHITLQTKYLFLTDNAIVSTSSKGKADAGHIVAEVGTAVLKNANIYSSSLAPLSGGNAGTISIIAKQSIQLMDTTVISTEAFNAGGGTISLISDEFVHLMDSEITSSVHTGLDNGGNILVSTHLAAMNHANINAKAYDGKGGKVHIHADYFIKSADSIIDVESLLGIDGSVFIDSADIDINKDLSHFSPHFLNAEQWMKTPCYSRSGDQLSRFILSKQEGLPVVLDDFLPCPLMIKPVTKCSNKNDSEDDLCLKATRFYEKGDFFHAIQFWETTISRLKPDQERYHETMICLANAYKTIGFQKKALSILDSILPRVDHGLLKALVYNCKGDIYLLKGDIPNAKHCFEKSVHYARLSKNPICYAGVLNNMANYYASLEDFSKALDLYTRSLNQLNISEQQNSIKTDPILSNPLHMKLKSGVLINIARLNMLNGDIEAAIHSIKRSVLMIDQLPNSHDQLVDYISMSILVQKLIKRYHVLDYQLIQIASQSLHNALLIAKNQQNRRMISCANGYLGQLYELQRDNESAKALTRKALFHAQEAGAPEIIYRWQWQLGRLFAASNQIEKALSLYKNAIQTLSSVRSQFHNGFRYQTNVFSSRIRPLYLERTDLLLKQAKQINLKGCLIQARDTMELLKQAEIADYYQDECLETIQSDTIMLNRIPEQTALIYPISLPDRLVILLTIGDSIRQMDIPVTAVELRSTAKKLFPRLQSRSNDLFRQQSRKLYKWLIAPVQSELLTHHVKTLVIVPDGVLRLIPFSALLNGNQFLIEKYALVTIPGISLTEYTPITGQDRTILINGLSSARQGYPPLKNVAKEIDYIQSILKKNTLLHDQTYTLNNLSEQFSNYPYTMLHLATHGHFGSTPEDTFLLTYDGKMSMNTLEHLIKSNRFRNPHIELLTLSACTTAMGNERAALGMAGTAIKAGVKSVIATLWQIDDEISSEIVKHFYHDYIQSDMSKAMALQHAQKQCIKSNKFNHPAYWAPFMLIGNWM